MVLNSMGAPQHRTNRTVQPGPVVGQVEQPPHAAGSEGVIDSGAAPGRAALGLEVALGLQGMQQGVDYPFARCPA
jgi:hypothetical protein